MENPIKANAPTGELGHFKNDGEFINELQNNYIPNPINNQLIGANPAKLAGIYQSFDDAAKAQFNRLVLHPDEIPQENNAIPNGWQPMTMADIYEPEPPTEYLAAGLLELPSLNIFFGAPGSLKSFLLQDLAICVASGKPWLQQAPWEPGGHVFKTIQAPVMWLDFDMGRKRTKNRFSALGRHYETKADAGVITYSMPTPPLDAGNPGHIAELAARIMATDSRLVVIDNLGNISGGVDENSSAMIGIMFNLRWLAEQTQTAVVVIHHQRKSNGVGLRAGDSLRGHSSIEAAIDLAMLVEREEYSDLINVKMTKSRGLEVLPFSAAFAFEAQENDDLITACFYSIAPDDTQSNRAIELAIKDALKSGGMIQSELWKAVKQALPDVTKNRIIDYIKRMAAKNELNVAVGINNSRVYSLPVSRFPTVSHGFPENRTE